MQCVVLRHIRCEGLGGFAEVLREKFEPIKYVDMGEKGGAPHDLEEVAGADLVISLGGPMAVYESERYPFIRREIRLIGDRLSQGRPTMGICLGAQIMAAAAGARVYAGGRQEIGWYPVEFTPQAAADPTWSHLALDSNMFFHWHGDTFELPAGAQILGRSRLFERQGFTLGRHGVALQFHAEIDAVDLEKWLDIYAPSLSQMSAESGIMNAEELRRGANSRSVASRTRAGIPQALDS